MELFFHQKCHRHYDLGRSELVQDKWWVIEIRARNSDL